MSSSGPLNDEDREVWERLAQSVTPLDDRQSSSGPELPEPSKSITPAIPLARQARLERIPKHRGAPPPQKSAPLRPTPAPTLNSHWERRLRNASLLPDVTLDLHGHTLDQAYRRLDQGLSQAKAMEARLVLVVTGRLRPVEAADRAQRRGAIRAKIFDWLSAGSHASDIVAVRKAHRRHGGEGALYIVLKRKGPRNGAPR